MSKGNPTYGGVVKIAEALKLAPASIRSRLSYNNISLKSIKSMPELIAAAEKVGYTLPEAAKNALLKNEAAPAGAAAPKILIGAAADVRGAIIELTKAERIIIERIRAHQLNTLPPFETHVIEALNLLRGRS